MHRRVATQNRKAFHTLQILSARHESMWKTEVLLVKMATLELDHCSAATCRAHGMNIRTSYPQCFHLVLQFFLAPEKIGVASENIIVDILGSSFRTPKSIQEQLV